MRLSLRVDRLTHTPKMVSLQLRVMPDDWSQVFTPHQLNRLTSNYERHAKYLKWYEQHGARFGEAFTTYTYFREIGVNMPRKMGDKRGTVNNNGGDSNRWTGGNAEWKWVNINLSDEDISVLSRSDATMEYLATCAVSLADDGIGFKLEPTDGGKSRRATLYRPNMGDGNVIVGVSSYSSTIRDALLAVLYKLDTYLGGDFSTIPDKAISEGTKPRFR